MEAVSNCILVDLVMSLAIPSFKWAKNLRPTLVPRGFSVVLNTLWTLFGYHNPHNPHLNWDQGGVPAVCCSWLPKVWQKGVLPFHTSGKYVCPILPQPFLEHRLFEAGHIEKGPAQTGKYQFCPGVWTDFTPVFL